MKRKVIYADYRDKLEGEYKNVFDQVEICLNVGIENLAEKNEVLNDIIELFLNAQNEGKPVRKIVGRNIEKFCDDIIGSISLVKRMKDVFSGLARLAFVIFVIELIHLLSAEGGIGEGLAGIVDVFPVFMGGVIGTVCISSSKKITKYIIFRVKKANRVVYRSLSFVVFFILVIGTIALGSSLPISFLIPQWSVFFIAILYFVSWGMVTFIINMKTGRDLNGNKIKRDKKLIKRISFKDDVHNKSITLLRKRCMKKHKRLLEKENRTLSGEEITKWFEKDTKQFKISYIVSLGIVMAYFLVVFLDIVLTSSLPDILLFTLIQLIIVFILFGVTSYSAIRCRINLEKELNKKGITIFDDEIMRYPE